MDNFFILTGAMGAGKTTLLETLKSHNVLTSGEPAREIIAEQRSIDGMGLYDRDPNLFYQLLLSRSIAKYKYNAHVDAPIVCDRGIVDTIAYAKLFQVDATAAENAAKLFRYNTRVFYLPAWEDIYSHDEDRKMAFKDAQAFGELILKLYQKYDYEILEVPKVPLEERAMFILQQIKT